MDTGSVDMLTAGGALLVALALVACWNLFKRLV